MFEKLLLNDNFVCLDTQTGALSLANPVAARIQELHHQGYTSAEITTTLATEYGESETLIAADVHALLSELATAPKRQLKPDQNHEPDTSYLPTRACAPVATMVCYLPTCRIHVQSESADVLSLMTPFFQLTPKVVQQENVNSNTAQNHSLKRIPGFSGKILFQTAVRNSRKHLSVR